MAATGMPLAWAASASPVRAFSGRLASATTRSARSSLDLNRAVSSLARRDQVVKRHVGQRRDQIAIGFEDAGVARGGAVEKGEGTILKACRTCRLCHQLCFAITAARRNKCDLVAKPGEIARGVEDPAARDALPMARVGSAGPVRGVEPAGAVNMGAANGKDACHDQPPRMVRCGRIAAALQPMACGGQRWGAKPAAVSKHI